MTQLLSKWHLKALLSSVFRSPNWADEYQKSEYHFPSENWTKQSPSGPPSWMNQLWWVLLLGMKGDHFSDHEGGWERAGQGATVWSSVSRGSVGRWDFFPTPWTHLFISVCGGILLCVSSPVKRMDYECGEERFGCWNWNKRWGGAGLSRSCRGSPAPLCCQHSTFLSPEKLFF